MSPLATALWDRAQEALHVARHDLAVSADATASRAYYAAFYAVSAHFALAGQTFKKHSTLEAAVHRDLVKSGMWPKELGQAFSYLAQLRHKGDYSATDRVSRQQAEKAIEVANQILKAVAEANPIALAGLFDG
jgi:uncharacterized protein (UPF0332 family)